MAPFDATFHYKRLPRMSLVSLSVPYMCIASCAEGHSPFMSHFAMKVDRGPLTPYCDESHAEGPL